MTSPTVSVDVEAASVHAEAGREYICRSATRPTKVFFLIDNLLGTGGAEMAVRKIVTHLPALGYEVAIGTFALRHDADFLRMFPCPVYEFPMRRTYDLSGMRMAWKLWRLVRRERFDIVHTIFPTADVWGAPIVKLAGGPLIVSGRRDMGVLRDNRHKRMYRLLAGVYDEVHTVSDEVRRVSISDDGLDPARVKTVHNGIELDQLLAIEPADDLGGRLGLDPAGATVIAGSGMVWPVKGVDVFIRAAGIVRKSFPHTNFIIGGHVPEGSYTEELKGLAESLGVSDHLTFIGQSRQFVSILKGCDVFCQLSRSEGMSNALLEAMACSLPCVATRVGGNPEVVVHRECGFLVNNEDHVAAAGHIMDLLADAALRRHIGTAARTRVEDHFTVEAMTARMSELYQALLEKRRS